MAQDAAKADPKHYKVVFENEQVRVLHISYGPGKKSVMHEHPEGVAVYLTDAVAKFTLPDGKSMDASGTAGQTFWTPASKHQPGNTGDRSFEVIQVEMKKMDVATVRKAVEAQNAKFAAAYNRGDAAGVAAIYAPDAAVLPPNHEMVQGRPAIEEVFSDMQMGASNLVLTTVDVQGSDDTAYEIGKYTITIKPEGQAEIDRLRKTFGNLESARQTANGCSRPIPGTAACPCPLNELFERLNCNRLSIMPDKKGAILCKRSARLIHSIH